ncbi:uncharacterized protein ARMOST_21596 [Armillaria ostoyae]|uniref:Uncharacterized protein n=1 Tax=Armillaria ostoyae TaxID=47428 RepID=A0A284SAM8_ARMOS|nr:uncharacterized protein ARMOST_21596 [Armillaria ostoyae]
MDSFLTLPLPIHSVLASSSSKKSVHESFPKPVPGREEDWALWYWKMILSAIIVAVFVRVVGYELIGGTAHSNLRFDLTLKSFATCQNIFH